MTFTLPEPLFDNDYPGHYNRRLTRVSLTVVYPNPGKFDNVKATLTLVANKVRISTDTSAGYAESPVGSDPRFLYNYAAVPQKIAPGTMAGPHGLRRVSGGRGKEAGSPLARPWQRVPERTRSGRDIKGAQCLHLTRIALGGTRKEPLLRHHSIALASLPVLVAAALANGCQSDSTSSQPSDAGPSDASSVPPVPDGGGDGASSAADADADAGACSPGAFEWATSGGGQGQGDEARGVAADKDGNVWVTGTFIGTATWGAFQLSAADTSHTSIFVAKLDPTGKVVLARTLQAAPDAGITSANDVGERIRVDAEAGDAYVAGTFQEQLDVDDVHLVQQNTGTGGAAFVLKLDHTTGKAVWGSGVCQQRRLARGGARRCGRRERRRVPRR